MKSFLLALLVVGSIGALAVAPTKQMTIDDTSVIVFFEKGIECSGTVVSAIGKREWILTARHCYNDGGMPMIAHFLDGDVALTGETVLARGNQDLILIHATSHHTHPVAHFTLIAPSRRASVYAVGAPDGVDFGFITSYVMSNKSSPVEYAGFHSHLVPLACIGCDSGMSGATGRNDNGDIVGVITASNQSATIGYMIPSSDVLPFVTRVLKLAT